MLLLSLALAIGLIGPIARLQLGAGDHERRESTQEKETKESPPEDWFISQRVSHGGIPAGEA